MTDTKNPYRDRTEGEMGFGADSGANPNWDQTKPSSPNQVAEGWKSESFSLSLSSGQGLGTIDPNDPVESLSGPAWPSKSKN